MNTQSLYKNKTIFFTRHGETQWNIIRQMQGQKDSPLTEFGEKQALWLKERLIETPIDVIYTSPLGRAYETAIILKGERDIPIIPSDELKEIYLGSWEGQKIEDVEKEYSEKNYHFWNEPHKYIPLNGETFEEVISRGEVFYNDILLNSPYENILVVSHAIMLKALFVYLNNKELKDLWIGPHFQPTCLTKATTIPEVSNSIDNISNKITFHYVADTSHYQHKSPNNGWFHDEK